MEHIFFEVQLCIKISIFNDFCENWYTDHPGLPTGLPKGIEVMDFHSNYAFS